MGLKIDTFTGIVIGAVALLIIAAVITVNFTDSAEPEPRTYVTEDIPEAPVINAFIAVEQGDISMARAQYSQQVLDEIDENRAFDPFAGRYRDDQSRRMRIVEVQMDTADPERAYVTYSIDNYSRGGLFNTSTVWTQEAVAEVVREEDSWKINTPEYFY